MKVITITADFSGYPDGEHERVFRTGEEPEDLDDAYADLLIAKGYAEEKAPAREEAPAKPARPGFLPPANPAPQPAPEPTKAEAEKKDDVK